MTWKLLPTVLVGVVLALSSEHSAALELVSDSKPKAVIVIPAGASECERTAAQELQKYIKLMSEAELPIVTEAKAGSASVCIGGAGRAEADPKLAAGLEEDGFALQVSGGRVCIFGGADSGTLFGVYAFLEDLGCRWPIWGEDGESIPKMNTIRVEEGSRTENPAFKERLFYVRNADCVNWAVKNRINGFYTADFAKKHGNLYYLPPMVRSIHSFVHLLPPDKYFDKNPEFYAMIGGRRHRADMRGGQICTTNPDVIRIIAGTVRKYFKENPKARVFSIAPNDGYGWCECERCRALDEKLCKNRRWYYRPSEPVVSDRLCVFANEVAKQALFDMPDKELYMFAYVSYCPPPMTAKPRPQVTHVVCHYIPACYAHPVNRRGCPDNEIYNRYIRGWRKISPQMMTYAYTDKSQWLGLPRPVVRQMAADIKYFHSLGIKKYIAQSGAYNWPQMGALYYVTAKLLWNPKLDVEKLIEEWNARVYGKAAKHMMAFYDALEGVVTRSKGHYRGDPYKQVGNVYTAASLDPVRKHLDAALAAADDETVRKRIQKVADTFDYGVLGVKAICYRAEWDETGRKEYLDRAGECAEKLLGLKIGWGGTSMYRFKEYLESIEEEARTGIACSGWGKVETKGGRECRNSDETGVGDNAAGWASFTTVIADRKTPLVVTMDIWGESDFGNLLICTKGKGAGTAAGGVWKPLEREGALTGKPEWCTIKFHVPPEMLDPETKKQHFGFGGADSQVWVASIKIEPR